METSEVFRTTIEVRSDGLVPDVARWRVVHRVLGRSGAAAARVMGDGAWMDLRERRLAAPPGDLAAAPRDLPQSDSFEELDSVVR